MGEVSRDQGQSSHGETCLAEARRLVSPQLEINCCNIMIRMSCVFYTDFVRFPYQLRAVLVYHISYQSYHIYCNRAPLLYIYVLQNIHTIRNVVINDVFLPSELSFWLLVFRCGYYNVKVDTLGHPGHGGLSSEEVHGSVRLGSPQGGQPERLLRDKSRKAPALCQPSTWKSSGERK